MRILTLIRQKSNKKLDKQKEQQKNTDTTKVSNINKNDNKINDGRTELNCRKEKEKEKEKFDDIFHESLNLSKLELSRSKSVLYKPVTANIFLENEKVSSNLSKPKIQSKFNKSKQLNIGHTETTTKFFDQKKGEEKKEKPSKKIINIIKKVVEWRKKSYQEFIETGKSKITKEEAALELVMKKKSLDDYLMIIRLGIARGFSFKENLDKKFCELRNFLK